jgi:hypothetical protein
MAGLEQDSCCWIDELVIKDELPGQNADPRDSRHRAQRLTQGKTRKELSVNNAWMNVSVPVCFCCCGVGGKIRRTQLLDVNDRSDARHVDGIIIKN